MMTPDRSSHADEPATPKWGAARLFWSASNREIVEREKEGAERRARERQAAQDQLRQVVQARRQDAAGRTQQARTKLQARNHQHRLAEGEREQFALDEKARRLKKLQDDHAEYLANQFVPVRLATAGIFRRFTRNLLSERQFASRR